MCIRYALFCERRRREIGSGGMVNISESCKIGERLQLSFRKRPYYRAYNAESAGINRDVVGDARALHKKPVSGSGFHKHAESESSRLAKQSPLRPIRQRVPHQTAKFLRSTP
jgi:hypothetical protein